MRAVLNMFRTSFCARARLHSGRPGDDFRTDGDANSDVRDLDIGVLAEQTIAAVFAPLLLANSRAASV